MTPLPPTRERPITMFHPSAMVDGGAGFSSGKPPRSKARRIFRIFLWIFTVGMAVGIGALASTAFIAKREIDRLLTPKSAEVRAAQKQLEPPLPGKPANILVLGSDYRTGSATEDRRSDTLMVVRLDPDAGTISLLSFPRDLYVPIPGHGNAKINDAYSLGGPKLSVQTVKELTGIDINYIVNVDFKGFRGIVDTLGGVYVDVDRKYFNDNSGGENYAAIDIESGYQLLRGRDALAFARFRHTDSDFHRIARQQMMLTELKKQVGGSDVVRNLPGLLRVLYDNTDMAAGGGGKISSRTAIDYLRLGLKLNSRSVYQIEVEGEIGTAGEASIVVADEARIKEAVDAFVHPDPDAQEASISNITGERVKNKGRTGIPPRQVTVEVRNGNTVEGAAGQVAYELRTLKYPVTLQEGEAGNADRSDYEKTTIYYKVPADKPAAVQVSKNFEMAEVEVAPAALSLTTRVLVVVGADGGEVRSGEDTADLNRVPEKAPPKVAVDPEYGLDDFQAIKGQIPFPLLYPTVRELNSTYDEVRAYKVPKGKTVYDAYRMVAKTGGMDYWGLQGTNWPDPPIIEDPAREVTRKGRTYMLYFNGTRLHMVAWRQGGAVYWVSNSVLNKLSNETMMAIAEGVRRVPN